MPAYCCYSVTLAASSEERNVDVWRPCVCLSRRHTQSVSPGGSMRRGQRTLQLIIRMTDILATAITKCDFWIEYQSTNFSVNNFSEHFKTVRQKDFLNTPLNHCRMSSSVMLPAGGLAGRPKDAWAVGRRRAGRVGGRHYTAGQYGYVPLWRHLVL